jgi:hypothetical protein
VSSDGQQELLLMTRNGTIYYVADAYRALVNKTMQIALIMIRERWQQTVTSYEIPTTDVRIPENYKAHKVSQKYCR